MKVEAMRRGGGPELAVLVVIVLVVIAVASCGVQRGAEAPYGGAQESALVTATVARDLASVQRLLAAGADPNKMVSFEGLYHAPWEIALTHLRPEHPETVEIVKAMLARGANPAIAWGQNIARGAALTYQQQPLMLVLSHPSPDVVRAIMDAGLDPRLAQLPLVLSVETGQTDIIHILVEHGVDVNCHPTANTPLLAAIEARNVEVMTYLEAHGAREKP
jgi:ankyrin repeat protein